jgi:serine/threonine-protein kinase
MVVQPVAVLGRYKVESLIGRGGMGEVYRARDTTLGREVAIKALPGALATDPERLSRFEREAHLLASLNHPHIAVLYGLERVDGVPFLAMSWFREKASPSA